MSKNLKVETGASGGYSPGAYYKEAKAAVVDVNSSDDVRKWSGVLGISEKELILAAENFGPVIRDIRRGLMAQLDDAA